MIKKTPIKRVKPKEPKEAPIPKPKEQKEPKEAPASPKPIATLKEKAKEYQHRLELILSLTLQTASLELGKDEYVELAPVPGMIGPCKLFGNSLPAFEYRVFDPRKKPVFMMEFVKVRVEISKPDRIEYLCTVDSEGSLDPLRHGEKLEPLEKYVRPFQVLSEHLYRYFPYYRNVERQAQRLDAPKKLISPPPMAMTYQVHKYPDEATFDLAGSIGNSVDIAIEQAWEKNR